MLDLAKHIVNQKTSTFEPEKSEDHYEAALTELINQKRNGKPIAAKARPKGENVVDLMDALKRNIANTAGLNQRRARSHARPQRDKRKCCYQPAASPLPRLKQRKTSLRRQGPGSEHDRRYRNETNKQPEGMDCRRR